MQTNTPERTTAPLLSLLLSAVSCVMRNCAQQAIVDKKAFRLSANPSVFTIKVKILDIYLILPQRGFK